MKPLNITAAFKRLLLIFIVAGSLIACNKNADQASPSEENLASKSSGDHGQLSQTKTFSSEVVIKWMNMQIRLMTATAGVANVAFTRPYAYSGIALYEAVVPGMPAYQSIAPQISGLTGLPQTIPGAGYHWAASANAALAYMNRKMFPNASLADKDAIDSLENALNSEYGGQTNAAILTRSKDFGKAAAQKVFDWAETDGYLHANDPFAPVLGAAYWVPPAIPLPVLSVPHWGDLRTIVPGSGNNTQPGPPPPYSEVPLSDFYKMVKEVYDATPAAGSADAAMAMFWRDIPGPTTAGHYVSILKQVLESDKTMLDQAALAYAMGGIMVFDAGVSCWMTKFHYNLVRPITYIRNVLGHTTWSPLLATPGHPEYSSAHAVLSAANAEALTKVFGEDHAFTDHTFDYLGMAARSYTSFREIGEEAGNSRLYAGIHYQYSINIGLQQGRKIAQNISSSLNFKK